MASEQAEATFAIFRQLREQIAGEAPTIEDIRAGGEQFGALTGELSGVDYHPVDVGCTPGQWIEPTGASRDHAILYLHGGGYKACSVNSHRRMIGHIAKAAGCRGLAIDYRLAPEHAHPAQVDDAASAYRWLLDEGFAPQQLAIAGDSAGGGLTMLTLLRLRNDVTPLPAAAVMLSPWVDFESSGESMRTRADVDLLITAEDGKASADDFLQGADPRDPTASPLHADLSGLPPIYIQVGDHEVLLDDSTRLAARLQRADVDVRIDVFPEMQHVFQVCAGGVPEADEAIVRIGSWLSARLGI